MSKKLKEITRSCRESVTRTIDAITLPVAEQRARQQLGNHNHEMQLLSAVESSTEEESTSAQDIRLRLGGTALLPAFEPSPIKEEVFHD